MLPVSGMNIETPGFKRSVVTVSKLGHVVLRIHYQPTLRSSKLRGGMACPEENEEVEFPTDFEVHKLK